MDSMNEPCPRCGAQPAVTKGPTYWTAYFTKSHFPGESGQPRCEQNRLRCRRGTMALKANRSGRSGVVVRTYVQSVDAAQ